MREMAEGEARGELYWTHGFTAAVRVRIWRRSEALADHIPSLGGLFSVARSQILDETGMYVLNRAGASPLGDFADFWRDCEDQWFPTVVEAFISALRKRERTPDYPPRKRLTPGFVAETNEILAQERVAWKIVDDQMIEMRSQELHETVVEPALRLLHSRRFKTVDATYRKALDELSRGDGGDAITDAGTALQELLTTLGCRGNQLKDLIGSASNKGLIGAHDTPLLTAVEEGVALGGGGQKPDG